MLDYSDLHYLFSKLSLPYPFGLMEKGSNDGFFICFPYVNDILTDLTQDELCRLLTYNTEFNLKNHLLSLLNLNLEFFLNKLNCILSSIFFSKNASQDTNTENNWKIIKKNFQKNRENLEKLIKEIIPYSCLFIDFYTTVCLFQFFSNYLKNRCPSFITELSTNESKSNIFFKNFCNVFYDNYTIDPTDQLHEILNIRSAFLNVGQYLPVINTNSFEKLIFFLQSYIPVEFCNSQDKFKSQSKLKKRNIYNWDEFTLKLENTFQCSLHLTTNYLFNYSDVIDFSKVSLLKSMCCNEELAYSNVLDLETGEQLAEYLSKLENSNICKISNEDLEIISKFIYYCCNQPLYEKDTVLFYDIFYHFYSNISKNISNIFNSFYNSFNVNLLELDNIFKKCASELSPSEKSAQNRTLKKSIDDFESFFNDFILLNPLEIDILNNILNNYKINDFNDFIKAISIYNFANNNKFNNRQHKCLSVKPFNCKLKIVSFVIRKTDSKICIISKLIVFIFKRIFSNSAKFSIYYIIFNLLYLKSIISDSFYCFIDYFKSFFYTSTLEYCKTSVNNTSAFSQNLELEKLSGDFQPSSLYSKESLHMYLQRFRKIHSILIVKNIVQLSLPTTCKDFNSFINYLCKPQDFSKYISNVLKKESEIAKYKGNSDKPSIYLITNFNSLLYAEISYVRSYFNKKFPNILYLCESCGNFMFADVNSSSHKCSDSILLPIANWYQDVSSFKFDKEKRDINNSEKYSQIYNHALAIYAKIYRDIILKCRFLTQYNISETHLAEAAKEDINSIKEYLDILFPKKQLSIYRTLIFDPSENIESWDIIYIYGKCKFIPHIEKATSFHTEYANSAEEIMEYITKTTESIYKNIESDE